MHLQVGGTTSIDGNLFLGYSFASIGTYTLSGDSYTRLYADTEIIGREGQGKFIQTGGTNNVHSLSLGQNSGSSGTYEMSSGSLSAHSLFVGWEGSGDFKQEGGDISVANLLYVASGSTSQGSYYMGPNAGTLSSVEQIIGRSGSGDFIQAGGINTVDDNLILGRNLFSSGFYLLQGTSSLETRRQYLGWYGAGEVIQFAGTNTCSYLYLGYKSSGSGIYQIINGGDLWARNQYIGYEGTGNFIQSHGTNIVNETLALGCQANSSGSYELSQEGFLESNKQIVGDKGSGHFKQSGGSNFVESELHLAEENGSIGTYNLNGGSLAVGKVPFYDILHDSNLYIGYRGTGFFTQSGGFFTIGNNAKLVIGYESGASGHLFQAGGTIILSANSSNLILGHEFSSSGTYWLMGGYLGVNSENVGRQGTGIFIQSGGENWMSNVLTISDHPDSSGRYDLQGGQLTSGRMEVGSGGTFTQTGGNFQTGDLINWGEVNFQGGTLAVTGHITIHSQGNLNISTDLTLGSATNDGTIKTTGATVTWTGPFTNNGAYISDPSTQIFRDLEVGPRGYLVGYSQDLFVVTGDLKVQSTQNLLWKTDQAVLQFVSDGRDNVHDFWVPGADLGPGGGADNFRWGNLVLHDLDENGDMINMQIVHLLDGNERNQGTALYLGKIEGLDYDLTTLMVANLIGFEGLHVYYDPGLNEYLGGLTYNLSDGGRLVPTPVPASVLLLGSGLLGLGLLGWRRRW
jgi:hypothetical protein